MEEKRVNFDLRERVLVFGIQRKKNVGIRIWRRKRKRTTRSGINRERERENKMLEQWWER